MVAGGSQRRVRRVAEPKEGELGAQSARQQRVNRDEAARRVVGLPCQAAIGGGGQGTNLAGCDYKIKFKFTVKNS